MHYELKKDTVKCPCCNGQGELVLIKCNHCKILFAECTEVGSVFQILFGRELRNTMHSFSTGVKCYECKTGELIDINHDDLDAVERFGFLKHEIQ